MGGRIFFLETSKGLESIHKKFLMPTQPFWDSGDLLDPITAEFRRKIAILQKFLHPQNRPFWGGVAENFSARTKRVPKPSEKRFGDI